MSPSKSQVRAAFARAADRYDAAAMLQREVCNRLLAATASLPNPSSLLDAGCGTGYGVTLLRTQWPSTEMTAIDFVPEMLRHARCHEPHCVVADIESLPFSASSFDAWWSSLALQWCDVNIVMREAHRVLSPGGWLAVSTLGPGTFCELREAFSEVDSHAHTIGFSDAERLTTAAISAGFFNGCVHRLTLTFYYPDLRTMMGSVKDIGANAVGSGRRDGLMGKDLWARLEAAYERRRCKPGLPATYDVILFTARR